MMKMSVDRGMIRQVTLGKNVRISPKIATNSLGWEVQEYDEVLGWRRVKSLPIVPQKGVAEMMMEEIAKEALEVTKVYELQPKYRVYEALQFPVQ